MDSIMDGFTSGQLDHNQLLRVIVRLLATTLLGAVMGFAQARTGNPGVLRMHMLVALAATLCVLVPVVAGISPGDLAWAIQGIAAGSGLVAGGAMLKLTAESQIEGLRVAAGLWVTAAVGVAVGLGQVWTAILVIILGWILLAGCAGAEQQLTRRRARTSDPTRR